MENDGPVKKYQITGIDFFGFEDDGACRIIFDVAGGYDIGLSIPTEIVSMLEAKLVEASKRLAARSQLQ